MLYDFFPAMKLLITQFGINAYNPKPIWPSYATKKNGTKYL